MDLATKKLELIQQLMLVSDEKILRRVAAFFKQEVPASEELDLGPAELEELDRRRAARLSGKSKGYTMEESLNMLKDAQAKDEAA